MDEEDQEQEQDQEQGEGRLERDVKSARRKWKIILTRQSIMTKKSLKSHSF